MKKAKLKIENARMKRKGHKLLGSDTEKFKTYCRTPVYGNYFCLTSLDEKLVEEAKQYIYEKGYKAVKARLRKYTGAELKEPKWITHEGDMFHMPTVGWKAEADRPITQEACRKMYMSERRAMTYMRRAKKGKYWL